MQSSNPEIAAAAADIVDDDVCVNAVALNWLRSNLIGKGREKGS